MLEADIRDFFGSLNHAQLREFLRQRVRDGVVLRLIDRCESSRLLRREALFVGRGQALVASSAPPAGGAVAKPPGQGFGGHEPDPALA